MHEMWCGADTSGEPMWHVLRTDEPLTLCGMRKREEPGRRAPTDKYCFPCMQAFQAAMASTKS
ncbi:hypothetical protein Sipo8835_18175 [Streptomyces ipomoeae]|jgi:hypothetical protein|uniref:Uncharacterized protein n=1 Tax=Streptomyces ipomoeae TaxID=103232 RepID=A0A540PCB8_9ACTN|nr:hypothetical protein Sipo7851_41450 [Streptomyces ipomoeae]TQE31140.1 hypothetical protein SipoB123_02180 [Streptomyces ipomoeae]TQE33273.1 hypothetical protein Sipo8835_18175 [Streptomyces ipomoeae]